MVAIRSLMVFMFIIGTLSEKVWIRRHPRYLVFPPGLGNKLQIICGFGVPIDAPRTSLTYGLILKTNYVLPTNATQFTDPYVAFARRGIGASRWHLYYTVEALLSRLFLMQLLRRLGLGGRSCLLRAVCEAAETPLHHNGLMGELLHILLTPTSTEDEPIDSSVLLYYAAERYGQALLSNNSAASCSQRYATCDTGLLDIVTTLVSESLSSLL